MHSANVVEMSDRLPMKIEFIDTPEKVEELLPKLQELAGSGLIEVQETTIAKPAEVSKAKQEPARTHVKIEGKALMMHIFFGESDRWRDQPLHEALIRALRAHDLGGATVYRGILGYGAHRRVHRESALRLSRDASMMISVIDTEARLREFLPIVDQMVEEGLVVLSDVDVIKYAHRSAEAAEE